MLFLVDAVVRRVGSGSIQALVEMVVVVCPWFWYRRVGKLVFDRGFGAFQRIFARSFLIVSAVLLLRWGW